MKISDELKQRIKQLEVEQERQQKDLVDLEQLRDLAAIEEMEKELASIDQHFAKLVPAEKLKDIEIDEEAETLKEGDTPIISTPTQTVHDIDLTLLDELSAAGKSKKQGKGFVILLMFDLSSPTEWSEQSGGGWRGKGQGTVYSTKAEAEAMLKQLKQKWADYPLRIVAN